MSVLEGTFVHRESCACHVLEGKAVIYFSYCGFQGLRDGWEKRVKILRYLDFAL